MLMKHEPNFAYESFLGRNGICDLKVYENKGRIICLVSEINCNPGPSVTNSAEFIYDKLSQKYDNMVMIEHYTEPDLSYDLVTVANGQPHWKRLTKGEWLTICGE